MVLQLLFYYTRMSSIFQTAFGWMKKGQILPTQILAPPRLPLICYPKIIDEIPEYSTIDMENNEMGETTVLSYLIHELLHYIYI